MRLIRLEISGFKSFCDKTALSFVQDGVSVVVGPNGCGKSNLVDAVRWALGEQSARHLRGASMEDVIFSGSAARSPVSMAQVTLVFSNPEGDTISRYSEFSEIAVTRRLYRSGESQYLINKTACRLTDIRELFMDTGIGGKGYSIIEQGKIDQIVTSRPEERRAFIDEAAGIVKFKAKRREAERKFAASKQNLLRVEDIVEELTRQEETLKEQVAQAETYLNRKGRLERLQQCTAATRWFNLNRDAKKIEDTLEKNSFSGEQIGTVIETMAVQEATLQLELAGKEAAREEMRRTLQDSKEDIIKLEGKLETDRAAVKNLEEWLKRGEEERVTIRRQMEMVDAQIETHQNDGRRLDREVVELEARLERVLEAEKIKSRELTDKQSSLEKSRSEELNVVRELNDNQNRLSQSGERLEELKQSERSILEQLKDARSEAEKLETTLAADRKKLDDKKASRNLCQGRIEGSRETIETQEEIVSSFREEHEDLNRALNQAVDRHKSLQELIESHEAFDSATREFLDYLSQHPDAADDIGFTGTLAELVAPPDPEQPQALAFLNRYFNLLVFSSVQKLQKIVDIVRQLELEQLQMFFMDLVENNAASDDKSGTDWIRRRSDLPGTVPLAASFRSSDVPLYEIGREELIKADGLIDPNAAIMTRARIFLLGKPGKTNQAEAFFNRQRELKELGKRRKELKGDIRKTEERLVQESELLKEHRKNLARYESELINLDLEIVGDQKVLDAKAADQERLAGNCRSLERQQEQIRQSIQSLEESIEALSTVISSGQEKQLDMQEQIEHLKLVINEASQDRQEHTEESQGLKVNLAGLVEKQKNNQATLERLETEQQQRRDQLQEIGRRAVETGHKKKTILAAIQKSTDQLPQKLKQLDEIEKKLKKAADDIESIRNRLIGLKDTIHKEQKKRNSLTDRTHKLEINLAQLKQEAKNIEDNLYAESRVKPEEVLETFDVETFNITAEAKTIEQLKQDISGMEDINLAAKKEYDVLMERLDFLRTQSADLEQSIEALENSIEKINQESRRRFRDSFRLINEHFNRLFPQLFGGGEAYLELTDESDLLESGVEIIAQPPGKKLQNMTLLSGGEKALTAIALVFAVFQIKPSPFCLLDEVDAPLDEANNERFNRHVKLLTQNSQFIIITHNKKTMEIGDTLFGVTMEEPGISKIVSVDFNTFKLDDEAGALVEGI